MSARDRQLVVIRGWIEKAENDLKTAVLILRMKGPTDTLAFHAQQCAEKYLKALLASRRIGFPKTHDLGELVELVSSDFAVGMSVEEQRRLTVYATITRYPGDFEPVSRAEARRAVSLARRVRAAVRKALPKDVLNPSRRQ